MMKKLSLFLVTGMTGVASGNAFNINEHDARVTGRGGATAATNTTPSSIVFNPGGIAVAEGTNVLLGGSIYLAEGSYQAPGDVKTTSDSAPSVVPAVYLTSRLTDMVAVGVGMHFPFGLAVSWPDGHAQAEVIQDQALRTYFITPSVGLNLDRYVPGLSIGGGVDVVPATVKLQRAIYFGDTEGSASLGGDALGVGGRVGVMYHPQSLPALKLGVMWRSQVKLDFSGTGDFDIADPYRAQLPPDGDIATSITLPQSVWGGLAYSVLPELELEANAVWIDWSKVRELRIELPGGVDTVSPFNYEDRVTFRVGGEYTLPRMNAAVRAGFVYDPTPIPSTTQTATLPDINRKNLTLGGSKYFGNYGAHLGLLWVTPGERETSNVDPYMPQYKATYGVQAFVASLMFSGSFGGSSQAPRRASAATVASAR